VTTQAVRRGVSHKPCVLADASRRPALPGHEGFVKGVAWDPIGTYLASQSDDKSVIIWRCEDWSALKQVREPFALSKGSTYSLRLCWSPDGRSLATTNSHDKSSQTSAILDRGDWKARSAGWVHAPFPYPSPLTRLPCAPQHENSFVGHRLPVVAVRFNSRLFHPQAGESRPAAASLCSVVAIGSQDCQVTIWLTSRPKPVVVLKHFFTSVRGPLRATESAAERLMRARLLCACFARHRRWWTWRGPRTGTACCAARWTAALPASPSPSRSWAGQPPRRRRGRR